MTVSINESKEVVSPSLGNQGTRAGRKSDASLRSNPVCLEVAVTVKPLPGERAGITGGQPPSREETRTVIVFDNGAVLRLAQALAPGQTIALVNAQGREVGCRIVTTRSLPNIKGYVELEFLEAVPNYWGLASPAETVATLTNTSAQNLSSDGKAGASGTASPHPVAAPSITVAGSVDKNSSLEPPVEAASKRVEAPQFFEGAPGFEDIAGLINEMPSTPVVAKPSPVAVAPAANAATESAVPRKAGLKVVPAPSSQLPTAPSAAGLPAPKDTAAAPWQEATSASLEAKDFHAPALPTIGRMSSGLQTTDSQPASQFAKPSVIGAAAAVILLAFGGGWFLSHRSDNAQKTEATPAALTQTAPRATAAEPPSAPVRSAANAATASVRNEPSLSPAVETQPAISSQPVAAIASVAAGKPLAMDSAASAKRLKESVDNTGQADKSSRPAVPNLKLKVPTAPKHEATRLGEALAAPTIVEPSATTRGDVLSTIMRSDSLPTVPRPGAMTAGSSVSTNPVLLTSVRPSYPPAAKQASVQGAVVVTAQVDENGNIKSAQAVSGPALLRAAAVESVLKWKYRPAAVNGSPAPGVVTVSIDFKLN
jgi:TonB family protein